MAAFRISVLASGSKGNSVYLEGTDGALLVDAGLSAREILKRMAKVGARPDRVRGILLTHEHSDHLRGAGVIARRLGLPVYATPETLSAAVLPRGVATVQIRPGSAVVIMGIEVLPFSTPHDAANPVGFVVSEGAVRVGIATDLGCGTTLVREKLHGCRALVLESNHDERMLMDGPYPWYLKHRVRSRTGHLSNEDSSRLLAELTASELERVYLAHLSEVNNAPDLASGCAREALAGWNRAVAVQVTSQHEPLPMDHLEY